MGDEFEVMWSLHEPQATCLIDTATQRLLNG